MLISLPGKEEEGRERVSDEDNGGNGHFEG